jgi:tRNA A37 threonylcarbamoyladenosine dehydratase
VSGTIETDAAATTPTIINDNDDDDWLQRARLLYGAEGIARLASSHVLIVGLGGVGSFAAEAIARAGVGSITIVDGDTVDTTNRNRQLPALRSTVGMPKADVVAARLRDINPQLDLTALREFLDPDSAAALVTRAKFDFVVDAIDSIAPKQHLLLAAAAAGVPAVSSMGAGGRVDPSKVRAADLQDTYGDALAAHVRRGLRKKGFNARGVVAIFSDEPAARASLALTDQRYKQSYFGTNSYMPALFGLYAAQHVIRTLVGERGYRVPRQPPPMAGKGSGGSGSGSGRSSGRSKKASSSSSGGGDSSDGDSVSSSSISNSSGLFASYSRASTGGMGVGWDGSGI